MQSAGVFCNIDLEYSCLYSPAAATSCCVVIVQYFRQIQSSTRLRFASAHPFLISPWKPRSKYLNQSTSTPSLMRIYFYMLRFTVVVFSSPSSKFIFLLDKLPYRKNGKKDPVRNSNLPVPFKVGHAAYNAPGDRMRVSIASTNNNIATETQSGKSRVSFFSIFFWKDAGVCAAAWILQLVTILQRVFGRRVTTFIIIVFFFVAYRS